MISINNNVQVCEKCGSNDLECIGLDDNKSLIIWCNCCNDETLRDLITVAKIKGVNFIIE